VKGGRRSFFICHWSLAINDYRASTNHRKDYNSGVNAPVPPKAVSDDKPVDNRAERQSVYAAEATGLLLIAALLLVLIVIRYWGLIPWGAR
jgi:hypothetical protein